MVKNVIITRIAAAIASKPAQAAPFRSDYAARVHDMWGDPTKCATHLEQLRQQQAAAQAAKQDNGPAYRSLLKQIEALQHRVTFMQLERAAGPATAARAERKAEIEGRVQELRSQVLATGARRGELETRKQELEERAKPLRAQSQEDATREATDLAAAVRREETRLFKAEARGDDAEAGRAAEALAKAREAQRISGITASPKALRAAALAKVIEETGAELERVVAAFESTSGDLSVAMAELALVEADAAAAALVLAQVKALHAVRTAGRRFSPARRWQVTEVAVSDPAHVPGAKDQGGHCWVSDVTMSAAAAGMAEPDWSVFEDDPASHLAPAAAVSGQAARLVA